MVERALKAIYQYARVGDYRVIMEVTPDTITVPRVAHRREEYRD
jgi:mRNA-degrading endonuclease RelE of RelBE toxin-antitoxin system